MPLLLPPVDMLVTVGIMVDHYKDFLLVADEELVSFPVVEEG